MASITDFKAKFNQLAMAAKYKIFIPNLPLPELCISVNLPGRAYATGAQRLPGEGGLLIKSPYDMSQNDVTMTFFDDEKMSNRKFFIRWMDEVYVPKKGFGYKNDYAEDITITQLNLQAEKILEIELKDSWPMALSDLTLDANASDTPTSFTVTFSYSRVVNS